jgi:hypothetical protein
MIFHVSVGRDWFSRAIPQKRVNDISLALSPEYSLASNNAAKVLIHVAESLIWAKKF